MTRCVGTAASKSRPAYFPAAVNASRFKVRAEPSDERRNDPRRELPRQAGAAAYATRAHPTMSFFVPEHRGHDDLLNAAALLAQACPLGRRHTAAGVDLTPRNTGSSVR